MKKIILLILLFVISFKGFAEEKVKVLLGPFQAESEKNISFLTNSISEIISSKLKKEVIVNIYKGDLKSFDKLLKFATEGKYDFFVYGNLKVSNKEYTLDGSLYSVKQKKKIVFLNQKGTGTGTIFVHINDFTDKILKVGLKKETDKSSFVKTEKKKSWKSKKLDFEATSISRCDYDGDGRNELIISSSGEIHLYKKESNILKKIISFNPDTSFKIYGVDAIDLNKNGKEEIFVTAINRDDNRLNSFIMEWDGNKFVKLLKNQNYHYRLVYLDGKKTIISQAPGDSSSTNYGYVSNDYSDKLYKIIWDNGYKKELLKTEKGTNIYSFFAQDINKDIANARIFFNKEDQIKVLSKKGEELWVSGEPLGGSNKYFKIPSKFDPEKKDKVYFSQRLFFNDIDNDGKKELITVKNENQTTYFSNTRTYTKASVIVLSWGATGFDTKFKSSKISGYISDFYVGDIDNDGKKEIVYVVVSKDGIFGSRKSTIYTYNLY